MRKQYDKMVDPNSDVSAMRVLVDRCVTAAITLATIITGLWVYSFFFGKEIKELGLMLGLVGTLLSSLLAKAGQSFAERRDCDSEYNENEHR